MSQVVDQWFQGVRDGDLDQLKNLLSNSPTVQTSDGLTCQMPNSTKGTQLAIPRARHLTSFQFPEIQPYHPTIAKEGIKLLGADTSGLNSLQWSIMQLDYEPDDNAVDQRLDIISFLIKSTPSEDINQRWGAYNNTTLHLASLLGEVEIVQQLVQKSADPNITNFLGFRPLDTSNEPETMAFLKAVTNKVRLAPAKKIERPVEHEVVAERVANPKIDRDNSLANLGSQTIGKVLSTDMQVDSPDQLSKAPSKFEVDVDYKEVTLEDDLPSWNDFKPKPRVEKKLEAILHEEKKVEPVVLKAHDEKNEQPTTKPALKNVKSLIAALDKSSVGAEAPAPRVVLPVEPLNIKKKSKSVEEKEVKESVPPTLSTLNLQRKPSKISKIRAAFESGNFHNPLETEILPSKEPFAPIAKNPVENDEKKIVENEEKKVADNTEKKIVQNVESQVVVTKNEEPVVRLESKPEESVTVNQAELQTNQASIWKVVDKTFDNPVVHQPAAITSLVSESKLAILKQLDEDSSNAQQVYDDKEKESPPYLTSAQLYGKWSSSLSSTKIVINDEVTEESQPPVTTNTDPSLNEIAKITQSIRASFSLERPGLEPVRAEEHQAAEVPLTNYQMRRMNSTRSKEFKVVEPYREAPQIHQREDDLVSRQKMALKSFQKKKKQLKMHEEYEESLSQGETFCEEGRLYVKARKLENLNFAALKVEALPLFLKFTVGRQLYSGSVVIGFKESVDFSDEYCFSLTQSKSFVVVDICSKGKSNENNFNSTLKRIFNKDSEDFNYKTGKEDILGSTDPVVIDSDFLKKCHKKCSEMRLYFGKAMDKQKKLTGYVVFQTYFLSKNDFEKQIINIPKSISECMEYLDDYAWYRKIWKEGYLSQQGDDLKFWKRRYFKLWGIGLLGYHEMSQEPTHEIDLRQCKSIGLISSSDITEIPVDNSFRLLMVDGSNVDFYADDSETYTSWLTTLNTVLSDYASRKNYRV